MSRNSDGKPLIVDPRVMPRDRPRVTSEHAHRHDAGDAHECVDGAVYEPNEGENYGHSRRNAQADYELAN